MINKLTRKRPNRLLIARNNYFALGGQPEPPKPVSIDSLNAPIGTDATKILGHQPGESSPVKGPTVNNNNGIGLASLASGIASIGAATAPAVGNLINNINSNDVTQKADAMIQSANSAQIGAQSSSDNFDTLANDILNTTALSKIDRKQLGYKNFGQSFASAFAAGNAGFASGASISPLMGGVMATTNTIFDVIGNIFRNKKIKKETARVNDARERTNAFNRLSFNNRADNLINSQLDTLEANYSAYGGPLFAFGGDLMTHGGDFSTGVTLIGNGGTHESNPYEGVPMGVDPEGTPNLVEEGEVIFNDYVFSKRLKVPKAVRNKYKLGGPLTFADAALRMSKEAEERPNDPISQNGLEDSMMKLMIAQEQLRTRKNKTNTFSKGGKMGRIYAGEEDDPYSQMLDLGRGPINPSSIWGSESLQKELADVPVSPKNNMGIVLGGYTSNPTIINQGESTISKIISTQRTKYPSPQNKSDVSGNRNKLSMSPTWLRYIPAYASGVMSFTDALGLTNKPDYSDAESILEASRRAGTYQPARFSLVGNYLTYNPFDLDLAVHQANAESAAARRALMNTSGGNRAQAMAGILATDNNAINQLGTLRRGATEYNLKQRQLVEDFNRATNQINSEGFLKADIANQEALARAKDLYLKGVITASELKQKERQTSAAARSANLSNFINSLGDIGRENFSRNMIVSDPSKYYTIGSNGEITYKNSFYDLSEEEQNYITDYAKRKRKSKKARGGYLTIRKK